MVKTIKAAGGGGASINAPAGIQFVPAAQGLSTGDIQLFVALFKDTFGDPDRCVVIGGLSTSTVSIIEYKRLGESWVFDPADCAFDASVTLTVTAASQFDMTVFAIDDPAGTGDRVLFISTNDAAQTPDTFEINSIVLTPGSTSLTAVLSVVAGANQPSDTNGMAAIGIPLSTTRLMTFFQDDAHFADITEATGTYTFTYDDAKVLAVAATINASIGYSGVVIGSQVLLARFDNAAGQNMMWEMTAAAVLTEEFNGFAVVGSGSYSAIANTQLPALTGISGVFAQAAPYGGGDSSGDEAAYVVATFPLDDI
ncbi:hypothetical protein LCGC14_1340900 [marine sediment metagenome]|uniref:Uncharacterized protein n=1 Tax=marine sediment metagenome TaxID=412755 RepID=A0A0F9KDM6_9ZZZZ